MAQTPNPGRTQAQPDTFHSMFLKDWTRNDGSGHLLSLGIAWDDKKDLHTEILVVEA
jgi:hypothetical protein